MSPANLTEAQAFRISEQSEVWLVRTRTSSLQLVGLLILKGFNSWQFSIVSFVCLEPIFVKASLVLEIRTLDSSEPMAFADFSGLWSFLTFDDSLTFWRFFNPLATTTINPIILERNLGCASWWVRWWACPEHRSEWHDYLTEALDETSIKVGWIPECQQTSRSLRSELPVGITTATTTIITAISTNPDCTLPRSCCRLSTPWSLQHQGKWCSYPAKPLDELPVKVGKFKEDLDVLYWFWFMPGLPG